MARKVQVQVQVQDTDEAGFDGEDGEALLGLLA